MIVTVTTTIAIASLTIARKCVHDMCIRYITHPVLLQVPVSGTNPKASRQSGFVLPIIRYI